MNFLELTHKRLDISEITELVSHEECGAVSIFCGTTRNSFEDKEVLSLEYEAYDQMAIKAMTKICDEIRTKWNDVKHIAIYHRLGIVPVKESSVIIAISSPHRKTSLDAVQFTIDTLKQIVPIWKKEKYRHPEGTSEWKENKECSVKRNLAQENSVISKIRRQKINFDNCPIAATESVPPEFIQITANETEIERRVNCFVARKRDEIDQSNIQDFIDKPTITDGDDETNTCARVSSIVFKMDKSKGHLRVNRVKNVIGPQETIDYKNELDKLMEKSSSELSPTKRKLKDEYCLEGVVVQSKVNGIEERLDNVERLFGITSVPKDIYERLKHIEDKLLYLEGVSPEYFQMSNDKMLSVTKHEKKSYSSSDLDRLIQQIQAKST